MAARTTKAYSSDVYAKIDALRLMDDTFMSKVFDGQKDAAALLLQIILDDPEIKVISVRTQVEIKNLQGRSVRLDIRAKDSHGRILVIEIQRADPGASRKRARNISSMLDANALNPQDAVENLPETYVIFITENDVLGKGLPIYHIDRTIAETGEQFGDQEHIIYVNGENTDDTALGKLMHDFKCTKASDMNYSVLAKRVRYFKETQEGRQGMSDIVKEYAAEVAKKYAKEQKDKFIRQTIIKGFREGIYTKDNVSILYPGIKSDEIDDLYRKAQRPVKRKRTA